jgi:L-threonylcarbamoyladenylate synthase
MSAHPVFRAVTARLNKPLAAPSANRFGRISPTAVAHVESELSGRIPLIVDGGATEHGIESTIVQVKDGRVQVLRAGPITPDDLLTAIKDAALFSQHELSAEDAQQFISILEASPGLQPTAPGQLKSHYAPRTRLQLISRGTHLAWDEPGRIGSLAFSEPSGAAEFVLEEILSPAGDLREAAATLFAKLRRLDEAGLDLILAEPVPEHGLGIAIMDRLRKAAAEHAVQ